MLKFLANKLTKYGKMDGYGQNPLKTVLQKCVLLLPKANSSTFTKKLNTVKIICQMC